MENGWKMNGKMNGKRLEKVNLKINRKKWWENKWQKMVKTYTLEINSRFHRLFVSGE